MIPFRQIPHICQRVQQNGQYLKRLYFSGTAKNVLVEFYIKENGKSLCVGRKFIRRATVHFFKTLNKIRWSIKTYLIGNFRNRGIRFFKESCRQFYAFVAYKLRGSHPDNGF